MKIAKEILAVIMAAFVVLVSCGRSDCPNRLTLETMHPETIEIHSPILDEIQGSSLEIEGVEIQMIDGSKDSRSNSYRINPFETSGTKNRDEVSRIYHHSPKSRGVNLLILDSRRQLIKGITLINLRLLGASAEVISSFDSLYVDFKSDEFYSVDYPDEEYECPKLGFKNGSLFEKPCRTNGRCRISFPNYYRISVTLPLDQS